VSVMATESTPRTTRVFSILGIKPATGRCTKMLHIA
jgi:hypothetical protein